ncbi:MAG TPA: hypothetical protein VIV11_09115 [Kofleriaceae bacterium]
MMALAACKSEPNHPPLPAPPPPPPSPVEPVQATTPGAPGSQNLAPLAGVTARMREESSARPRVEVTAEALFDALADRGIVIARRQQVLAATAQAAYCALGVTDDSIAIAVCEYESQAAARAGKRLLDTRYAKLVPDAVRVLNGNTLVTVANATKTPARRDQVLDTFRSL